MKRLGYIFLLSLLVINVSYGRALCLGAIANYTNKTAEYRGKVYGDFSESTYLKAEPGFLAIERKCGEDNYLGASNARIELVLDGEEKIATIYDGIPLTDSKTAIPIIDDNACINNLSSTPCEKTSDYTETVIMDLNNPNDAACKTEQHWIHGTVAYAKAILTACQKPGSNQDIYILKFSCLTTKEYNDAESTGSVKLTEPPPPCEL